MAHRGCTPTPSPLEPTPSPLEPTSSPMEPTSTTAHYHQPRIRLTHSSHPPDPQLPPPSTVSLLDPDPYNASPPPVFRHPPPGPDCPACHELDHHTRPPSPGTYHKLDVSQHMAAALRVRARLPEPQHRRQQPPRVERRRARHEEVDRVGRRRRDERRRKLVDELGRAAGLAHHGERARAAAAARHHML
eukprot:93047-Chlamydomonas_euryale.AAC.1